jgi:hypothetical protein
MPSDADQLSPIRERAAQLPPPLPDICLYFRFSVDAFFAAAWPDSAFAIIRIAPQQLFVCLAAPRARRRFLHSSPGFTIAAFDTRPPLRRRAASPHERILFFTHADAATQHRCQRCRVPRRRCPLILLSPAARRSPPMPLPCWLAFSRHRRFDTRRFDFHHALNIFDIISQFHICHYFLVIFLRWPPLSLQAADFHRD